MIVYLKLYSDGLPALNNGRMLNVLNDESLFIQYLGAEGTPPGAPASHGRLARKERYEVIALSKYLPSLHENQINANSILEQPSLYRVGGLSIPKSITEHPWYPLSSQDSFNLLHPRSKKPSVD